MKNTLRVISGRHRGRVIPFSNQKFNDADITPQRVKEAFFSMIGQGLIDSVFIDLYSGSGQIGAEAISRGASIVVFNEPDKRRFGFIKKFVGEIAEPGGFLALNMKDLDAVKYLTKKGLKADFVFLDPPYVKESGETDYCDTVLKGLSLSGILNEGASVIVQHFTGNILPEKIESLHLKASRKYGTTTLTIYA